MTPFLFQFALSNLLFSAVLAGLAYVVHRRGRSPMLAHLLWVVVLLKLVTPPVLSLPLARLPGGAVSPASANTSSMAGAIDAFAATWLEYVAMGLLLAWALGSVVVLLASVVRITRFDRLLRHTSGEASARLQWLAGDVAYELGMRSAPTIYTTSARISPLTWWTGGRVRIVLPTALLAELDHDQLRWVLAHELAHVKRRDHMVRWLEWLACVAFWWNPVAWFARANLRLDEEAACDALVVEHLGVGAKPYARALLAVVEHLSRPALQPPAVATGIDGGSSLERRFRLLVSGREVRRVPRWLVAGFVGASLLLMPLGVGVATENVPPSPIAATDRLAADTWSSAAERAFLLAAASPGSASLNADSVADPPTAKLSAKVSTKQANKATQTNKTKQANKTKKAKAIRARKARARQARRAERVAAAAAIRSTTVPQ